MDECYICKELKENGKYRYGKDYTTIAIEKGNNGKYRCFAWGEGEASISCNFCPNCGTRIENNEMLWFSDRLALEKEYKKWIGEKEVADTINSFIAFLIIHDLIDAKKTLEYLRLVRR